MSPHETILDRRFVAKGHLLIKEGEEGTIAYLIQSGELIVFVEKDGAEIELARLGPGQIVGELALVFDAQRSANVKAAVDTNVIAISRQQFNDKLQDTDPTIRAIVQMLSRRIVDTNNALLNRRSDLADLGDTARIIYENIYEKVPAPQKFTLKNTVLPHLQSLLEAIRTFQDRYGETNPPN